MTSPLILDGHTDVPSRLLESPVDLHQAQPSRHVDVPRLRQGGVGGVVFAWFLPANLDPAQGLARARQLHRATTAQLRAGVLETVVGPRQLREVVGRGAVAVIPTLENGRPLSLAGSLEELVERGVRLVTLTHVGSHEWCDAAGDEPVHGGLSIEGQAIVRRLERAGVLVDVSHVSDDAVRHVLEVVQSPVVASHSSARALCDHPRNLTDELALAIARRGGVVMVNAYSAFLDEAANQANGERLRRVGPAWAALEEVYVDDPGALRRAGEQLFAAHPLPAVPLERLVDHILHFVSLLGPEHVGIGSDFDGITETPVGFEHIGCYPALIDASRRRGLDDAALRWVLGESFLRAWEHVVRAAAR